MPRPFIWSIRSAWRRRKAHRPARKPARRRHVSFYRAPSGARSPYLRLALVLLLLAAGIVSFILWIENRMMPQIEQMAISRISFLAGIAINDAINDIITENDIGYEDLIHFEKDATGRITALKTDMVRINRLKATVTTEVLERVNGIKSSDIGIPIGNLINGGLFAGRGPSLPIRVIPLGVVNVSFENAFLSAGINQTRNQILMNIQVDVTVLLPGSSVDTSISEQVNIAETIIVGSVPDSYANFDDESIFKEHTAYEYAVGG